MKSWQATMILTTLHFTDIMAIIKATQPCWNIELKNSLWMQFKNIEDPIWILASSCDFANMDSVKWEI